jgi:ATP synthase protein I
MKKGYGREVFANIALISQLGISMMVPIFLLLFIGIYLENKTGWFLTVPFLILGILAGCRNTYILANKANMKTKKHIEKEEENKLVNEAIEKWNKNK